MGTTCEICKLTRSYFNVMQNSKKMSLLRYRSLIVNRSLDVREDCEKLTDALNFVRGQGVEG